MKRAALLGNPNVGKTTLFNILTGSNQYVGNWAGVTVEKKAGVFENSVEIVDLPGIYAMDTYSNEETVSKEFLINGDVDIILNIVDASNLSRNLYLTMQLKEFKKPMILLLNMADTLSEKGIKIDYDRLQKELKIKVIPISASKGIGIDEVKTVLREQFNCSVDENDYQFRNEEQIYKYIDSILKKCVTKNESQKKYISEKIDKILLNKYLAYPILFGIFYIMFMFTFSWVGRPLQDILSKGLYEKFMPSMRELLKNSSPWFTSLIVDGVIGGVGSVIVFFPIILSLFLGLSFLEDSGYMARAALIMDKTMKKIGLSGKAFMPLMVGFGCSVPGIMSTRTLESEKDRKLTALIVPLMSCNARLPVYALFSSVFFPGNEVLVVSLLYLTGIIIAFLIALLFKSTIFKKDDEPFLIELPEYKLPEIKNLAIHTWEKGKGFFKKAGTIIFSASVLVWFLSNFNLYGKTSIDKSMLSAIGRFITPIFKPLGFGTWQNSVAIITGLMAKEVIIGTMGVLYGGSLKIVLPEVFTPLSALSFLIFVLLYTPCISVIATMKKEYGHKMAVFSVAYQFILAWVVSFGVYNIGRIIEVIK